MQAVVRQDGKAYVFVRSAQGFVPTPVVLDGAAQGAGQQAMQPVRSGLKVGDEVAVGGIAAPRALGSAWARKVYGTVMLQRLYCLALAQRLLIAVLSLGLVGAGCWRCVIACWTPSRTSRLPR